MPEYVDIDNISSLNHINLNYPLSKIGGFSFFRCSADTEVLEIPSGVTYIGTSAFCLGGINSLKINTSNSIKLDLQAFTGSTLKSLSIKAGENSTIVDGAFNECHDLSAIDLSESNVSSIGSYAFFKANVNKPYKSDQYELMMPSGKIYLGQYSFAQSNFSNIQFQPSSIIEFNANGAQFSMCSSLTSDIELLSANCIPLFAFNNCEQLNSIKINAGVSYVDKYAFSNCKNLKRVDLSNTICKYISSSAFINCYSLTSINFPETILSVGYDASDKGDIDWDHYTFSYCSSLITLDLPNSITYIGRNAFYRCEYLEHLKLPINPNFTVINDWAFYSLPRLKELEIPSTIKSVGNYSFFALNSLTSLTLHNGLQKIGNQAFYYLPSLPELDIPNSVVDIGASAFASCWILSSLNIGTNVSSIWSRAFAGCRSLPELFLPNSLTTLGSGAFRDCSSLVSLTLSPSLTALSGSTFYNCQSLSSLTIPSGFVSIGYRDFYNCASLQQLTLPSTVSSIANDAFFGCPSSCNIIFDKTRSEVSSMDNYNWGITSGAIIHCTDGDLVVS